MTPILKLGLLIACLSTGFNAAQAQDWSVLEKQAVAKAQQVLVSDLEPGMPKITLDYFLRYEAGKDAEIKWEANDCGEQTGDPATDRGRDIPLCAEADVRLPDGKTLVVSIAVGSVSKGVSGTPAVFWVAVTGQSKSLKLSDVPKELHPYKAPKKSPRDGDSRDGAPAVEIVIPAGTEPYPHHEASSR